MKLMNVKQTAQGLLSLLENAEELKDEYHQALFESAVRHLYDGDVRRRMMMAFEDALIERLGEKEYKTLSIKIAKDIFREQIEGLPEDNDFKHFALEHWDEITADNFEEMRLS